jgi:Leucine-rich repeat (LRR) protein
MFHNKVLFVFIAVCWLCSIGESGVVTPRNQLHTHITGGSQNFQTKNNVSELDCGQFIDDYDIIRQFPFRVSINLAADDDRVAGISVAFMDKTDTFVETLAIYNEKVVPWIVFCLSNLESLKIEFTPFENDIIPDAFINLKKLRNFWFYHSPIVKVTEQLRTLTNLLMLTMSNCSLTHLPNLSNFQKMWSLDLSNNRLSHVDGIPDVQFLDLNGNFFNHIPILENKGKLEFLTMSDNPLKNIAPIMFYKNLEGIFLSNTMLTSIPPNIDKLQNLHYIDVSNNKLSHLPTNILNLPLLEDLNISNNLLSPNETQSIRKAFEKSHPELKLTI